MEETRKVICPLCNSNFELDGLDEEGDIIFCPDCDAELEVKSVDSPKVVKADTDNFDGNYEMDEEDYCERNDDEEEDL